MKKEFINIRDPFILFEDGVYYMYGTRAKFTWGDGTKHDYGFDVYVSDDLESWSEPISVFEYYDGFFGVSEDAYYLCEAVGGSSYKIIVRDCLIDAKQNFIGGDIITLYGEGDENIFVYGLGEDYTEWEGPCINMAYVVFE